MDPNQKQQHISECKQRYDNMDPKRKEEETARMREMSKMARQTKTTSNYDIHHYISIFHKKIKEGPYYICSVCNRMLYRKSVVGLNKHKYDNIDYVFTDKMSFDNKEYICKTCHLKLIKGKIPCQAVCNNMYVDDIPSELAVLEKLEQILIAQRIVFEKIIIMPKGQQRKIKGAICNVPVECDQTCHILPRPPERSGIIMLKLKRKLQFRGHVYFQAVRPQLVLNALNWLQTNNVLYNTITIDIENIDSTLTSLQNSESHSDCSPDAGLNNELRAKFFIVEPIKFIVERLIIPFFSSLDNSISVGGYNTN